MIYDLKYMSSLGDVQAEALHDTDETDQLQISNETRKLVRTLSVLQDYISEYDQLFEQTFFERDRSYLPLIRYILVYPYMYEYAFCCSY